MATDKSLNIRQMKATEEVAAALAEMRTRLEAMESQLNRIEAALGQLTQPSKLQETSRSAAKK